jgi:hypothetical protein
MGETQATIQTCQPSEQLLLGAWGTLKDCILIQQQIIATHLGQKPHTTQRVEQEPALPEHMLEQHIFMAPATQCQLVGREIRAVLAVVLAVGLLTQMVALPAAIVVVVDQDQEQEQAMAMVQMAVRQ